MSTPRTTLAEQVLAYYPDRPDIVELAESVRASEREAELQEKLLDVVRSYLRDGWLTVGTTHKDEMRRIVVDIDIVRSRG
jgi:hypothetical protein